MLRRLKIGPGLLVAAAFVGPGTVTTASRAGAGFGFQLLWALLVATVAAIIFQEMAARLGLTTRQGLGEAIRTTLTNPVVRLMGCGLVVLAIAFGNAAYQTGNLTGAAVGLASLAGGSTLMWTVITALTAGLLLWFGGYRAIEAVLIGLVALMGLVFVIAAVMLKPSLPMMLRGAFTPSLPDGSLLMVIGLLGTTVVPYNLFLHASSVQQKWPEKIPLSESLAAARWDTLLSVSLGGAVTMAIMVTAAAAGVASEDATPAEMARQLEGVLGGSAARICFAVGLFAAGLSSSITAPLAAAYTVAGVFGWPSGLSSGRLRGVWIAVLLAGVAAAAWAAWTKQNPTHTIIAAQVANGLLLPLIALFLLLVLNNRAKLGRYANGFFANLAGGVVLLIAAGLGGYKVLSQFGLFR